MKRVHSLLRRLKHCIAAVLAEFGENPDDEWRGLDLVRQNVLVWLSNVRPELKLHAVHYVPHGRNALEIYVFYETETDLRDHETNGISRSIESRFVRELKAIGRGPEHGVTLRFEFDSHVNVEQNYAGNYFLRLR